MMHKTNKVFIPQDWEAVKGVRKCLRKANCVVIPRIDDRLMQKGGKLGMMTWYVSHRLEALQAFVDGVNAEFGEKVLIIVE